MKRPGLLRRLGRRLLERERYVGVMILDEWKFLFRIGRLVLVILLGLPLFYPPVISWLYKKNQAEQRPVVLVDEDNSALSRQMSVYLSATQNMKVLGRLDSLERGRKMLIGRQAEALIQIPADFSTRFKKREQTDVTLWIEAGNMYAYSVAYPAVFGAVGALNEELGRRYFFSQGVPNALARQRTSPIQQDIRYLFHPTTGYGNFFVPGVFLVVMQQLLLIAMAFSVGMRRELNQFDYRASRPFAYLEGKYWAQMVFYLYATVLMLLVIAPLSGWTLKSVGLSFLVFVFFQLTMMPVSVAVAHFCRDRYVAFQLLMFVSTPLFMMSGFAWPYNQMLPYIKVIGALFPVTPALQAMRITMAKSDRLIDILPYFGWMAAQFVVYFAGAYFMIRRWPVHDDDAVE